MSLATVLDLRGEVALVVGGGAVAVRRAATLLEAGLRVRVVAPEVRAELRALDVEVWGRGYERADLNGVRLAVAATNDAAVNDAVAADARAAGVLVNHAGDASRGTLRFPAVVERAGVRVAVSTGRALPMLAQALSDAILALLPDGAELDAWSARRAEALALSAPQREAALAALRGDIARTLGARGAA